MYFIVNTVHYNEINENKTKVKHLIFIMKHNILHQTCLALIIIAFQFFRIIISIVDSNFICFNALT